MVLTLNGFFSVLLTDDCPRAPSHTHRKTVFDPETIFFVCFLTEQEIDWITLSSSLRKIFIRIIDETTNRLETFFSSNLHMTDHHHHEHLMTESGYCHHRGVNVCVCVLHTVMTVVGQNPENKNPENRNAETK